MAKNDQQPSAENINHFAQYQRNGVARHPAYQRQWRVLWHGGGSGGVCRLAYRSAAAIWRNIQLKMYRKPDK
jgi:hypothetical protein